MAEVSFIPDENLEVENISDESSTEVAGNLADAEIHGEKESVERIEIQEVISMNEIANSLSGLSTKIDEMNTLFVQKIQHTTHEERIVDQMHSELQKYREDMYSQLARPILMDIIEVRDSIMRMSQSYMSKPDGEQNIPLKVFSDYAFDVQDILEKNNISIYECVEGDTFVPIKQKVIKKVETNRAELHGKVVESFSQGYDYNGKILSPAKVSIYEYKESSELKGEDE